MKKKKKKQTKMPFYGSIVVIKRSGADGSIYPLVNESCLLGRNEGCDIRVQLATVSREHCKVTVNENKQVRSEKPHQPFFNHVFSRRSLFPSLTGCSHHRR